MRKLVITVFLLGSLFILTLLLTSCDGDDDGDKGAFVLDECRIGDQDCRLR